MKSYLITDTILIDENYTHKSSMYIGICDGKIDYIGNIRKEGYDEYIDGSSSITAPAYYNAHAHSAMTLLRGAGSGLPLGRWLNDAIFPLEAKLSPEDIYYGTQFACLEMLRYGTVSCNDMYFYGEAMLKAYANAGFKSNISVSVVSFDEASRFKDLPQFAEYEQLFTIKTNDKIKTDLCVHAEYTNNRNVICDAAEYAFDKKAGIHLHLSETAEEHNGCKIRRGVTPAKFMESCGIFKNRTIAAHCVFIENEDYDILKENGVFIASCPQSNLKLGSGIFDYKKALEKELMLSIGTDGAASNNNLNMSEEMRQAVLLAKGTSKNAEMFTSGQSWEAATVNGALSQGRDDCGKIKIGYKADIAMYSIKDTNMLPIRDAVDIMLYSSDGIAGLVMCDGEILYKNGEYYMIDKEKVTDYVKRRAKTL